MLPVDLLPSGTLPVSSPGVCQLLQLFGGGPRERWLITTTGDLSTTCYKYRSVVGVANNLEEVIDWWHMG